MVDGFTNGFDLSYCGELKVKKTAPNLKLRIGSQIELWNKVMTEVKAGRYAGPFEEVPFEFYIQSPIGLVPKDKGKKTRLIFHLSFPKDGESVNSGIPVDLCKVTYPDFSEAIRMCLKAGKSCFIAKSDMSMAFRNVPLKVSSWAYLVLKCQHPVSKKTYYFFDKCLPFGSSISCSIFQEISNSISHIVKYRTGRKNLAYLDDYFFVALIRAVCNGQVDEFLRICSYINFPVSLEKTFWGTTILVFLGLLIDTVEKVVRIPKEKIEKALILIEEFLTKKDRKVTVLQIQKLCGTLNFLCKCVIPGKVFMHRFYSLISNSGLKQHHHVRSMIENREDLLVWKKFLLHPQVFCRPFLDLCNQLTSKDIDMYSDASGAIGFSAYCGSSWTYGFWDEKFLKDKKPGIEFLELYRLTVGILLWIKRFKNKSVCLFCDNENVKYAVNNSASRNKNCMTFVANLPCHLSKI